MKKTLCLLLAALLVLSLAACGKPSAPTDGNSRSWSRRQANFSGENILAMTLWKCMWRSVSGTAICLPENPVTVTLPVTASWIK